MTEMANGDYVNIESFHDPFDGRIIRYRYERADFSIYSNSLLEDEIKEIQVALEILRRFDGMPQMEWIRDLCSRFDVSINTPDKPVVEFEDSDTVFGREFFTGLFHAIVDKRPIFLDYQRFGKKPRTHLLYPYYLKQFKQRWYLVAKNAHHLDSISSYALDRMVSFHPSLIDEYVPIDIDVHDYFKDVYGIARMEGEPQIIKFHVDKHELPYLQTRPIHHSQKIVGRDKTGVFMTIQVIPNTELMMELMSYGDGITVKTKGKLRSDIMRKLSSARKKYGSST
jgi:predicted DNA-binding transcriptional regulator YafY